MSVSVCGCVCLSVRNHVGTTRPIFTKIFVHVTCGFGSVFLCRRSDKLCISGFVDDVIFAHKLIGCSTLPPGWGSEAHTCAALRLARRNTRCRQRTPDYSLVTDILYIVERRCPPSKNWLETPPCVWHWACCCCCVQFAVAAGRAARLRSYDGHPLRCRVPLSVQ